MSTDALLFYGITLPDEDEREWLVAHFDEDDWEPLNQKLIKLFGVTLGTHQSCECPVFFIAINDGEKARYKDGPGGYKHAWRGDPRFVDTTIGQDWNARIKQAADYLGWPEDERGKLGWWLASHLS